MFRSDMAATPTATAPLLATLRRHRRLIIGLLLGFAAAYGAASQSAGLDRTWRTLADGSWLRLVLAVMVWLVSLGLAAGIYCLLAYGRLRLMPTMLVQLVSTFASRIVPVGLGSVSVNFLYLRHNRLNRPAALAVVAVNNLLGVIGHLLWLAIGLAVLPWQANLIHWPSWRPTWWLLLLGVTIGIALIGVMASRRQWQRSARQVVGQLAGYWRQPWRLAVALLLSMLLTACYGAALWLSGWAIGVELAPLAALLALTLGMLALTVTPTPGGLGGVEAGVVAALVAFGQPAATALAIALLFRLVTYWLPLLLGGAALLVTLKLKLL